MQSYLCEVAFDERVKTIEFEKCRLPSACYTSSLDQAFAVNFIHLDSQILSKNTTVGVWVAQLTFVGQGVVHARFSFLGRVPCPMISILDALNRGPECEEK